MSQTVVWTANKGTTTRVATDGSPKQGAGACKRLYVGRYGSFDYRSYINVGYSFPTAGGERIVSAVLTLSTDDGFGILGDTMAATDTPQVRVRRLTSAFSEGTSSAVFATADYTIPTNTASGAAAATVDKDPTDATNIDITAMVEEIMPKTMRRRNGKPGGAAARHGFLLYGDGYPTHNAAFISEDAEAPLAAFEPYITLTYELGATTPDAPTNLTPTGAVDDIGSFQGNFTDPRASDKLSYSHVQVYTATAVKSGTASATTNFITVTAHGYANDTPVWFHSLTGGVGLGTGIVYYVRAATANTFKVALKPGGAGIDITDAYSALTVAKALYDVALPESNNAITNGIFDHTPDNLHLVTNVTYKWRARVKDNENIWSPWTALFSISVTNTAPNAPSLSPPDGTSKASLGNVEFKGGTFTDPDAGDTLLAYEVQLSAYPEGDPHWLDDEFILWNSGKTYVSADSTEWHTFYGGNNLTAGTYHWRARQYDNHQGVSDWAYASIILTADFEAEPQFSVNAIQMRPRAPWRIVIRDMYQADGVTRTVGRGPGRIVAVLEDAMNVGASLMYNSPGEAHWTLGAFHPQLSVLEPKQTHYAIEFRQGDGWREVFAGLVWDIDATSTDIIFYGIDYLALLDYIVDEKYKLTGSGVESAYNKGGSKYSTVAIRTIIADQLNKAKNLSNSPVGFIGVSTVPAALSTTLTVYSTYQPVLNFIVGLLDSYRAGSGKRTRISVQKTTAGGYTFVVTDDPGVARDDLRLRYGELVNGFRVIPFGKTWATRVNAIGRDKDGIKVRYKSVVAPGISEATWGRFMTPQFMDGVSDDNDLARRARQYIVANSMLGTQMGLGLRSGVLQPRDGYDLLDKFPIDIDHGAIQTTQYGHDGYWVAVGITWQAKQSGEQNTTLTLQPQESGSAPSADLLVAFPIQQQAEWQIGWTPANPLTASSKYWLNQTTGIVEERTEGDFKGPEGGVTGDV